jgi:uncharacterized repeat protein (TIGR01451 family)
LVLTGYTVTSNQSLPVTGPDVTTTVQTDRPLAVVKMDSPDSVNPGGTLTYTLTVSNTGAVSDTGIVVRELFDPNLTVVSSSPPPDLGTTDRWSIGFLPAGGYRVISIVTEVDSAAEPGTLIRNFAIVNDDRGRTARAYEDTLITDPSVLSMGMEDLPDPVGAGDQVTYTIDYANQDSNDVTGVVVHVLVDPRLTLISSSPPEDPGTDLQWTIGNLPGTTAGLIFATFSVDPAAANGSIIALRGWVDDDSGHVASASQATLVSGTTALRQYAFGVTGAPRNLRIGVVTTAIYVIKARNIGAVDTTNVKITNVLPSGLQFLQSIPPPSSSDGGILTYNFPTFAAGSTKQIIIQAELLPTTLAGTGLADAATLIDAQGNYGQATFTGGVRAGTTAGSGKLTVTFTTVRQVLAGSNLKSTITINNGGRTSAEDVVLTVDSPQEAQFVLAIPGPSSVQTVNGKVRLTWNVASIKGPGNQSVKLTQRVQDNVAAGTVLTFNTNVTAKDGRSDQTTNTVTVRN